MGLQITLLIYAIISSKYMFLNQRFNSRNKLADHDDLKYRKKCPSELPFIVTNNNNNNKSTMEEIQTIIRFNE